MVTRRGGSVLLCALPLLLCGPGSPVAQSGRGVPVPPPNEAERSEVEPAQDPEERQQRSALPYVSLVPGVRPRRVAPGQQGRVMIVVALRSEAVLESEAPFEVTYQNVQGPIALEGWQRAQAAPGARYARYRDRLVYEDSALVEIPFSVALDAEHGEHAVAVRVATEVHHGETGESLGRFDKDVRCQIPVGDPLPTPSPPSGAAAGAPAAALAGPSSVPLPRAEHRGFELRPLPSLRIAIGERYTTSVELVIPEDYHVSRDGDLGLPQIAVQGLVDGVLCELGAESEPEQTREGAVYRGRYARRLTWIATADARLGPLQPVVSLRYISCDEDACYPPETLSAAFALEVVAAGEPTGVLGGADAAGGEAVLPPDAELPGGSGEDVWLYLVLGAIAVGILGLVVRRSRT